MILTGKTIHAIVRTDTPGSAVRATLTGAPPTLATTVPLAIRRKTNTHAHVPLAGPAKSVTLKWSLATMLL